MCQLYRQLRTGNYIHLLNTKMETHIMHKITTSHGKDSKYGVKLGFIKI